jgi:hypothetical protein
MRVLGLYVSCSILQAVALRSRVALQRTEATALCTHTHTLTHYRVYKHAQRHQVEVLAAERRNWLFSPDALIRAARHYESAAQILISHAVMTAQKFVRYVAAPPFANSESVSRCYTLVPLCCTRLSS